MRLVIRRNMGRLVDSVTLPETPVLPMYHRQRTRFQRNFRTTLFLLTLGIVGFIYGFYFVLLGPFLMQFVVAPIGILALIVIWALPDEGVAPTRWLTCAFWGFWITLIAYPNYLALVLPGMPWITVNRLFGVPMLLCLLVAVSISAQFRAELRGPLRTIPAMWKMLVAFVACQFVAMFFSETITETASRTVNLQITWTAIFFVSAWLFTKPGAALAWARSMMALALLLGLMALVEAHYARVLWADHIPSFLKVSDEAVMRVLEGSFRNGEYRVVATYMSSLSLAEFFALASAFVIHGVVTARGLLARVLLVALDGLLLTGILYTQARLGMVGFLLSHSIYGLYWAVQRWRTNRTSLLGPALTLAYPALLVMISIAVVSIGRLRVLVFGGQAQQVSNDARHMQYAMAGPRILHNPLGYGAGQSGHVLGFKNLDGEGTIDSYILSAVLDYGVIGFALFYGMLALAIVKSAMLSSRAVGEEARLALPVSITLVVFVVIRGVLSQEANNPIMFMLLGMVAALAWRDAKARA